MISNLTGEVLNIEQDYLILNINGIGFRIYAPVSMLIGMKVGDKINLHTHLVVRQDSLTLYGFDNAEKREYFQILISVSGIGPRLALSALSSLDPETIRRAIFNEQTEVFSRIPGIGKKTAQKIILFLQDRIPKLADFESISRFDDLDTQVLEALISLGYSVVEAQAALQSVPRDAPDIIEERLRMALNYFA